MIARPAALLLLVLVLWPRHAPAAGPPGPDQPVPAAPPRSREQLFQDVFKRPAPAVAISGYVFVQIDGGPPHKISAVLPSAGQGLQLQAEAVLPLLSGVLPPAAMLALSRAIDRDGWLAQANIVAAGVATAFDAATFMVTMKSDPARRPRSITYLGAPPVDPSTVPALRPAAVSAFLNLNAKAVARTESPGASHQPGVGLAIDGAVNVNGWIFEGSGLAQVGGTNSTQRGDLRLVHDQPQRSVRYNAGDLRYPLVGYQAAVAMAGVGVSKDLLLQPHLRNLHAGGFQFYLEHPAEVQVWVNDRLLSVLRLPAGPHDLRGLSPVPGLNDTRLEIEDSAGRKETLVFAFAHTPALLEQGGSLYSYNLGWRRVVGAAGHHYDLRNPVLSASHLLGVAKDTTLGGYLQADRSSVVLGLHALRAFAAGAVQLDAAVSRAPDARWGRSVKLGWTAAAAPQRGLPVQTHASVEYLSKNFGTLTEVPRAEHDRINVDAALAFPLGYATSAEFRLRHASAPAPGLVDAHGLVAGLTRRIGRHTTVSLSWRNERSSLGERRSGVLFGLTWSFSDGLNHLQAAKEMGHEAVSLSWRTAAPTDRSGPYAFAATRWAPRLRDSVAGAGYTGPQGLAELAYRQTGGGEHSAHSRGGEAALRLEGALVYADGVLALSRPVSESFAIVKGKEGLAQTVLRVDPNSTGGSRARSTSIGPAVVTDLGNYQLRELRIEPVDPPLGATPDKTTYPAAPGYKSGLLLLVGREVSIVAVGRLLDRQGQPLGHLPIEVRPVGEAGPPISTFTSRSGAFQLPGVKPGRYEIRPAQAGDRWRLLLDVPHAPDGLFRLGDLRVPES